MATVELTLEQILGAVEQLTPEERVELHRQMLRLESSREATQPAKRKLMPRPKRKRMSELLLKASSGPLTSDEDVELNALVDEFESQTLANAKALAKRKAGTGPS